MRHQGISTSNKAHRETEGGLDETWTPDSNKSAVSGSLPTSDSLTQGPREILASIEEMERQLKVLDDDVQTGTKTKFQHTQQATLAFAHKASCFLLDSFDLINTSIHLQ